MTLDELIEACRAKGPWHFDKWNRIRTDQPRQRCPLQAVFEGDSLDASINKASDAGLEPWDIIRAADSAVDGDPAIRAALLTLVEP